MRILHVKTPWNALFECRKISKFGVLPAVHTCWHLSTINVGAMSATQNFCRRPETQNTKVADVFFCVGDKWFVDDVFLSLPDAVGDINVGDVYRRVWTDPNGPKAVLENNVELSVRTLAAESCVDWWSVQLFGAVLFSLLCVDKCRSLHQVQYFNPRTEQQQYLCV